MARIALACDHAGYPLKERIVHELTKLKQEVVDLGAYDFDADDDYPDYALKAAFTVANGEVEKAVILCGSGVGASIAANKVRGIRAAVCHDTYSAHQGVEHDNMNVLCLGGRIIGIELAAEVVRAFVSAHFSGEERHRRRLAKISRVENQNISEPGDQEG